MFGTQKQTQEKKEEPKEFFQVRMGFARRRFYFIFHISLTLQAATPFFHAVGKTLLTINNT